MLYYYTFASREESYQNWSLTSIWRKYMELFPSIFFRMCLLFLQVLNAPYNKKRYWRVLAVVIHCIGFMECTRVVYLYFRTFAWFNRFFRPLWHLYSHMRFLHVYHQRSVSRVRKRTISITVKLKFAQINFGGFKFNFGITF